MTTTTFLKCKKCLEVKNVSQFSPSCISRKGKIGYCRVCRNKLPSQTKLSQKKYRTKDFYKKHNKLYRTKNAVSYLLSRARNRAKEFNLEFNIECSDIVIPEFCPILNIKLIIETGNGRTGHFPSIDRIDNTKGYTKDNIIIVSDRANYLKNCSPPEERELMFYGYKKLLVNQYLGEIANKYTDGAILYKPNKKLKFTFDKKKVKFWMHKYCPIFNISLVAHNSRSSWEKASVDRIDNSRGYDLDNIVIVSYRANSYKRDATLDELWLIHHRYKQLSSKQRDWIEV